MVIVKIICPICKSSEFVSIPKLNWEDKQNLLTVSVPKGLVCQHHFQAFLDCNFNVRGYQKVDIELKNEESSIENKNIFQQIEIGRNTVKFAFNNGDDSEALKSIYNEFWEFIDDENTIFSDLIKSDEKRKHLKKINNFKLDIKDNSILFGQEVFRNNNSS